MRAPGRFVLGSMLIVCAGLLATKASAATHPSLLFGKDDIAKIRARLAGPLKPISDALKAGVNFPFEGGDFPKTPDVNYKYFDDRRAIADTVAAYAFAATMLDPATDATTVDRAKQLAHDYLVGVCGYGNWVFPETQDSPQPDLNLGHFLFSVTLAYDWLYDSLTDGERKTCRDRVAIEGAKMYAAARLPKGSESSWWIEEYLQNHYWVNHAGLGMAALGFEGELGSLDVAPWLSTAENAMTQVKSVIDPIAGGAWHEGIGYVNYGLDALVPFSLAHGRLKGGADWADNGLVHDYARLRMFASPPAQAHDREYPVYGDYSGYQDDNTLLFLRYVQKAKKDGLAAWAADQYQRGEVMGRKGLSSWPPEQRGMLISAVVYDDAVPATPPSTAQAAWTRDYYAPDLSLMISRGGWGETGAPDTMLVFKTGVFGGHYNFERLKAKLPPGDQLDFGHDHDDDMNVWLFGEGEWLTLNVPGYWIGRVNGEPEANRTKYANSLLVDSTGQLGDGPRPDGIAGNPWFFERTSAISLRGSTAHYSYSLGAGSKLYDPALGLDTFGRAILFVDRRVTIVRDVVSGAAPHQYDVLWHAPDAVERDGAWLKLHAKNGRALGVKVVSPADFTMTTETQTTYHLDSFDPDGSMTAAYVHPTKNVAAVTFLHALVPIASASAWGSKASVEAIDPASLSRGVSIDAAPGEHTDAVFADAPTQSVSANGLALTGMAAAKKTAGGKIVRVLLAAGSKLAIDGTPWIEVTKGDPATLEVEPTSDGVDLSGEVAGVRVYAPGAKTVRYNGVAVAFDVDGDQVVIPKSGESLDAGPPGDSGPIGDDASIGDGSIAAPAAPGDGGGSSACGCSSVGQASSLAGGLGGLAVALSIAVARRRRARGQRLRLGSRRSS